MQDDPALGVIIQQPAHQPPALGGLGVTPLCSRPRSWSVSSGGCQAGNSTLEALAAGGTRPSNAVRPYSVAARWARRGFWGDLDRPHGDNRAPGDGDASGGPGDLRSRARAPSSADKKPAGLRGVARGFSWGTVGQLTGVAGNLVLTPFIIHGLGVERYGIFVLVVTLTGMLTSFDGGVMGAAARYFAVYAGTDDRRSTTRLLVTFCVLLTGLGIVISIAAWFLSPVVVGFLNMSAVWRPQAIFLFRTLGLLVTTFSSTRCSSKYSTPVSAGRGAPLPASPLICSTSSGSSS